MMAHYQDATFITAVTEEKKMPVLNKNDGQVIIAGIYRCQEFLKFQNNHSDTRYSMGVLEAVKVPEAMGDEMTGVVVNPIWCGSATEYCKITESELVLQVRKSRITFVIRLFFVISRIKSCISFKYSNLK